MLATLQISVIMRGSFNYIAVIGFLIKVIGASSYNGSVVEYNYAHDEMLSPGENLMRNVAAHVKIIHLLRGKSQIVVFPECSLSPEIKKYSVALKVPDPSFGPPQLDNNQALQQISDAAKASKIYVVINVIEQSGKYRYNTNVAFRSNGTIAARYRKYNLYNENVDRPPKAEAVYFDTDFSVRFGLFTCFDILFPHPAMDLVKMGIKHIACPNSWSSQMPFLTAIQIQHSWAWKNNVTLLAAGLNAISIGISGSGFYTGRRGHLSNSPFRYYMANKPGTLVITKSSEAPTLKAVNENVNSKMVYFWQKNPSAKNNVQLADSVSQDSALLQKDDNSLILDKSSLTKYTTLLISPNPTCSSQISNGEVVYRCHYGEMLCNGKFCCEFNITVDFLVCENTCAKVMWSQSSFADGFLFFRYRLAVFDGVMGLGKGLTAGMQSCAVIPCLNKDLSSCGLKPDLTKYSPTVFTIKGYTVKTWAQIVRSVHIRGRFENNNTLIMPSVLLGHDHDFVAENNHFGVLTNKFTLNSDTSGNTKFHLQENTWNLGVAGIITRVFNRDGLPATGGQPPIRYSSLTLISIILMEITFYFLTM